MTWGFGGAVVRALAFHLIFRNQYDRRKTPEVTLKYYDPKELFNKLVVDDSFKNS
jgi:hypothetical protein